MTTSRLELPLLAPGQAQKEWTHNEALAMIDIAAQAVVEAVGVNAPPAAPAQGACWIIGTNPTGAWAERGDALAGWTAGGWRFIKPREGMAAWSRADATLARFGAQGWRLDRSAPIAAPTGGTTIDAECRQAMAAILAAMRARGWLA